MDLPASSPQVTKLELSCVAERQDNRVRSPIRTLQDDFHFNGLGVAPPESFLSRGGPIIRISGLLGLRR